MGAGGSVPATAADALAAGHSQEEIDAFLKTRQSAFVFVKPHANTEAVRALVKDKFSKVGVRITAEGSIDGPTIDAKQYIDQHYYAIASKATIMQPRELNVPVDKFEAQFGETWEKVLDEGRVVNALDACKKLGCDADALDGAWAACKKAPRRAGRDRGPRDFRRRGSTRGVRRPGTRAPRGRAPGPRRRRRDRARGVRRFAGRASTGRVPRRRSGSSSSAAASTAASSPSATSRPTRSTASSCPCGPSSASPTCPSGQEKSAKFPTSKAPLSAVFHSFRLIFGRAIISWNDLEA